MFFKKGTPVPVTWRGGATRGVGKWFLSIPLGQVMKSLFRQPLNFETNKISFDPGGSPTPI